VRVAPADPGERVMSLHETTLKIVTNLDRAAIEAKLVEVRTAAQSQGFEPLAQMFAGIEGMPRAQIQERVRNALRWMGDKPQLKNLADHLELIELNLPNLN